MLYREVSLVKCPLCGADAMQMDEGECYRRGDCWNHDGEIRIECDCGLVLEKEYCFEPYRVRPDWGAELDRALLEI